MSAYEAVKTWVYSGGDDLAALTFKQGQSDLALAAALYADWPTWSEGECPYSQAELEAGFAELREEMR